MLVLNIPFQIIYGLQQLHIILPDDIGVSPEQRQQVVVQEQDISDAADRVQGMSCVESSGKEKEAIES